MAPQWAYELVLLLMMGRVRREEQIWQLEERSLVAVCQSCLLTSTKDLHPSVRAPWLVGLSLAGPSRRETRWALTMQR